MEAIHSRPSMLVRSLVPQFQAVDAADAAAATAAAIAIAEAVETSASQCRTRDAVVFIAAAVDVSAGSCRWTMIRTTRRLPKVFLPTKPTYACLPRVEPLCIFLISHSSNWSFFACTGEPDAMRVVYGCVHLLPQLIFIYRCS